MLPSGLNNTNFVSWTRRVDVPAYITNNLALSIGQVFHEGTNDWGMEPWHNDWLSPRGEKQLSVAINDGSTWFHGYAGDYADISTRAVADWNQYPSLLDAHIATFYHVEV